jgi:hypothetical protein
MGKKHKGKPCAYCFERLSETADHVFAREFFLPGARANLPQVPACSLCNGQKSALEHYLTSVLPFAGRHEGALPNLKNMVPQRLAKNAKLHRTLRDNWGRIWAEEGGIHIRVSTLPLDPTKLQQLFALIVRGLVCFHFGTYLRREDEIPVFFLARAGETYFDRLFSLDVAARVNADLGHGTFCYEGAQDVDCPQITVWRFQIYGGVKFADSQNPGEISGRLGAWSGPVPVQAENTGANTA